MTTKGFPREITQLFNLRTQTSTPTKMLSTLRLASSDPKAILLSWHLTLMMEVMVSHPALPMQAMVTLVTLVAMAVTAVAMVVVVEMAVAEMVVVDQRKFALDAHIQ